MSRQILIMQPDILAATGKAGGAGKQMTNRPIAEHQPDRDKILSLHMMMAGGPA